VSSLWFRGLWISLAAVAVLESHGRLSASVDAADAAPVVPTRESARFAALGFESLLADYYWLRVVQLVGAQMADPGRHAPLIGRLTDVVVGLDPFVDHPYRFAALWLSDREDTVAVANRLLERGIAYHPTEWRNRFYLAYNYFFELGDSAAAARELGPAIELPGAPRYLGRLLARLQADSEGIDVAAAFLEELRRNAPDGWYRTEYEKALDEIETERRARFLDRARQAFVARNGRDIQTVEELVRGPGAVLRKLPEELHGWEWVIDPASRKIVSSYYGRRYKLNFQRDLAVAGAPDKQPDEIPSGRDGPERGAR